MILVPNPSVPLPCSHPRPPPRHPRVPRDWRSADMLRILCTSLLTCCPCGETCSPRLSVLTLTEDTDLQSFLDDAVLPYFQLCLVTQSGRRRPSCIYFRGTDVEASEDSREASGLMQSRLPEPGTHTVLLLLYDATLYFSDHRRGRMVQIPPYSPSARVPTKS